MATFGDDSLPPTMRLEGVRGENIPLYTRYVPPGTSFIGVMKGAKGLDMPQFDVQTDAYPTLDGEFIRYVRAQGREIFLPIVIYGDSRRDCIVKKRDLLRYLNPKVGTVKLVTSEATGPLTSSTDPGTFEDEREIELYYANGFEGDEGSENGLNWIKVGLVFRATYPFFRGLDIIHFPFYGEAAAPVQFFAPPAPTIPVPEGGAWGERVIRLSQENPFTKVITIDNEGDIAEYPTWKFIGPIAGPFQLVLVSQDGLTDQIVQVTNEFVLAEGATAEMSTRPGEQGISSSEGNLDFKVFGFNPNFWALEPGENIVEIRVPPFEEDGITPRPDIRPEYVEISFKPTFTGM